MQDDEYRKMYEAEETHWWYVSLHDLVARFVACEHVRKGSLLIYDAGCGTGMLCRILSQYGRVSGCDISDQALSFCRMRGLQEVEKADLNTFDPGDEQFDVVTSIDVLYHDGVLDEIPVLKKFYDSLRPGGILIINLPAYEFLRSSHDLAVKTARRYTRSTVIQLLKRTNFIIEKSTYRVGLPFFPIAAYRLALRPFAARAASVSGSDVWLPPSFVNKPLCALMRLENSYLLRSSLPFGTSVFVVGRKPAVAAKT